MLSLLTFAARCVGSGAHVSLPLQGRATFSIASKHTLIRSHLLPKQWQLQLELQRKEWQLQQQELQAQLQQKELQAQAQLQQKELQAQLQLQQKELQAQLQQKELQAQLQLQQKELQLRDMQLQNVTRNLLVEKGKLSMRGLIGTP
jgi:Skp family chaperone for outer membrane proteins